MPNPVDDIFKAGLEDHYVKPDSAVWDKLDQGLSSKEGRIVLPWYFNPKKALFAALFISFMSFGGGYIYALLNDGQEGLVENPTANAEVISLNPNKKKANSNNDKTTVSINQEAIPEENQIIALDEPLEVPMTPENRIAGELDLATLESVEPISGSQEPTSTMVLLANAPKSNTEIEDIYDDVSTEESSFEESVSRLESIAQNSDLATLDVEMPVLTIRDTELQKPSSTNIISTPLVFGNAKTGFFELSYGWNQRATGYSWSVDADDPSHHIAEYSSLSNFNIGMRFGKSFHKNIGAYLGMQIHQSSFTQNFSRTIVGPEGNFIEKPSDRVNFVNYQFSYSCTSLEIPMAVRLKGNLGRIGYHGDFGVSLMKGISQPEMGFTIDKEIIFDHIGANAPQQAFDMGAYATSFTRVGLEYYLFSNGGVTFDAVLRKRLRGSDAIYQNGSTNISTGFNVGLFKNF